MNRIFLWVLVGVLCIGWSKKETSYGEPIDPNVPVVAVDELVQYPQAYSGKLIAVEGRMIGVCPDGQDFFFKGKYDTIEVIPPHGKMPSNSFIGKPATVWGMVEVHAEGGETEHDEEPEVKVQAKGIVFK